MPSSQFGPYRLMKQIAVGGMAEIHLAKTKGIAGFEKFVALKMIHPNFSEDQQFIEMLIDEAKLTVQLQHVNIAQTFDLGRVDDTFYITMEFVDGADLYKLLRTGAEAEIDVPIEVAGYIAKEVANGLDYAHRKRDIHGQPLGIVHRDVSPQNVLISRSGEVKIVDFGIAKATMRARQTAVGVIKGKYYYMSPEQAWGETLDPRSDIFSCGILLYEMLTGQMLYLEEDLHKLLGMVRKADIASPTTLRKGIPARLERIVMRALARKPENRYQSAADLASDLERFLHAHSPIFTQTKVVDWSEAVAGKKQPLEPAAPKPVAPVDPSRNTAHITRDQLFLDASEFTDHNSVIFEAAELDAMRGAQIRSGPDGSVEVKPGPNDDELGQTRDVQADPPYAHSEFQADDEFDDLATVAHGSPIPRDPLPPERMARRTTRPIDAGPDFSDLDEFGISERTVVSGPPEMAALAALSAPPPSAIIDGLDDVGEETIPTDDRTLPEQPRRMVAAGFDEPTAVSEQPATAPGRAPKPAWEKSAALVANNPKPAVSAIRQPRRSRKTPPNIPAQSPSVLSNLLTGPGRVPRVAMGESQARDQASAVGLAGPMPPAVDPVAAARPVQPRGPGAAFPPPAGPRPPGAVVSLRPGASGAFPGANPALMNTSMQLVAVEVDDIPDIYKLRRGGSSKLPWILGGIVVLGLIAVAAIAMIAGSGGEELSGDAKIDVVSMPAGGSIYVNNEKIDKKTPAAFLGVKPGKTYIVAVELENYQRWESEVTVPVGESGVKVIATMEPLLVTLRVESSPSDAEVFLNSKSYGRTPLSVEVAPTAATELVLKRQNYLPVKRKLDWSTERIKSLSFGLKKF